MKTVGFILALTLVACAPDHRSGGGGDDGGGDDTGSNGEPKQCNQMDIVFVVDDSNSMKEEQDNLRDNFPMFAQILSDYKTQDGTPINFRVALTTTGRDLHYTVNFVTPPGVPPLPPMVVDEHGPNGKFVATCGSTSRWLEPSEASFQNTLACRANVGINGSGTEMPMLMTKWALDARVTDGANAGFIRPDALLGIVMLTDEDDSSTTQNNWTVTVDPLNPTMPPMDPIDYNPADHVQFLDTLKGHRSRWSAAVIAGDGDCTSGFGKAADAQRLKEFVDNANATGSTQAVFSSICDGDLTIGLKKALDTFQAACGGIIL